MNEALVRMTIGLYGLALVGNEMLTSNMINKINIEVPLAIMCKLNLNNVFQSHFVSDRNFSLKYDSTSLPKEIHLIRKTRPPNIQWA